MSCFNVFLLQTQKVLPDNVLLLQITHPSEFWGVFGIYKLPNYIQEITRSIMMNHTPCIFPTI